MKFIFSKKYSLSDSLRRYFIKIEADCLHLPNTIAKYKEIAGRLIKLMGDINLKKISDVDINRLKQKLNERNLSPARKNHHIVLLNNLFSYLENEEKLAVYGGKKITRFKVLQKEIKYLTKEQLIQLANAPKETTITGLRMRAVIRSMISSSLRVSELLSLNRDDIDFETGIAHVRTKGNKASKAIFNEAALDAIDKYLTSRKDKSNALFATSKKRWEVGDLQRSLRNLGRKLKFRIPVTPHCVARRSVATLMYREGVPIGIIQAQLNHSSSQVTTKFYIGNLAFDDVLKHHKRVMNFDFNQNSETNNSN